MDEQLQRVEAERDRAIEKVTELEHERAEFLDAYAAPENHFDADLNEGVDWFLIPLILVPLIIACALIWWLVL